MDTVIFSFGGGLTSFFGAIRALEQYGADNVVVVNAALHDDEPYIKPVLDAFANHTGVPVQRITLYNPAIHTVRRIVADAEVGNQTPQLARWLIANAKKSGRSQNSVRDCTGPELGVWDVFFWAGIIGNDLRDPCSQHLKRETLRRWIQQNYSPGMATIAVGMTDDEIDRQLKTRAIWRKRGYDVIAPLSGMTWDKAQALQDFERITGFRPDSYMLGLKHNNCGACVKAGQGEFARVLYYRPDLYRRWAWLEQYHQQVFQHGFTILKDQRGGTVTPLSLYDFEARMRNKWAGMNILPGMEHLMFFGLEETPSCRFCESAA